MRFYDFEDFLSDLLESGYSYNYFGNNLISDLTYIFSEGLLFQLFKGSRKKKIEEIVQNELFFNLEVRTSFSYFFFRFNTALSTMASRLATTIPFEKNIWKAVGMLTKRLLLFRPTPAAIDTAAIRKLCSLLVKSTRARICIP